MREESPGERRSQRGVMVALCQIEAGDPVVAVEGEEGSSVGRDG